MAFTEQQITSGMFGVDPTATGRTITIASFIQSTDNTDCYCVGVTAPYAGRSRWVQIPNSNAPAQAVAIIKAALA